MTHVTSWIIGGFVAVFGLLGLILTSRALDQGIALFGMALFVFAVLFVFGLMRRAYDARERTLAEVRRTTRPRAAA